MPELTAFVQKLITGDTKIATRPSLIIANCFDTKILGGVEQNESGRAKQVTECGYLYVKYQETNGDVLIIFISLLWDQDKKSKKDALVIISSLAFTPETRMCHLTQFVPLDPFCP